MSKIYDLKINKHQDWGGDISTLGLPVSGNRVLEFVKDTLESKFGFLHYDDANQRYLCFADEENRNLYLEDPISNVGLIQGSFLAPSEYKGFITLISESYNAVLYGQKNVYLEYTFDIVNSQNVSTGEGVQCIYTITNGNNKKVVNDRYKGGEHVKFLLDEHISEGLNRINIQIIGEQTLASTSTSCQFEMVHIILEDQYKINTVNTHNGTISIPYRVQGAGTKKMEWYLDGVKLAEEANDTIYQTETNRIKNIRLESLNHGPHSLLFRVYMMIGSDKFYSKTIFKNFIVTDGVSYDPVIGFECVLPIGDLIKPNEDILINGIMLYDTFNIVYSVYNPLETSMKSIVSNNGNVISNNDILNGEILIVPFKPTKDGENVVNINIDNKIEQNIYFNILKSDLNIQEITSGLQLDLNPFGRNNNDKDKDKWEYGNITTKFNDFEWTELSGWTGTSLLIKEGTSIDVNYSPFKQDIKQTGYTFEIEFKTYNNNVFSNTILSLMDGNVGFYITGEKIEMRSRDGKNVHSFYKYNERIRISFVVHRLDGDDQRRMMFIYLNGSMIAMNEYVATDSFLNNAKLRIECTPGSNLELFHIRAYERSLNHNEVLNNYLFYLPSIDLMLSEYDKNDIYEPGTQILSVDKLAARSPVLLFTGDVKALLETKDKGKTIYLDEIQYIDRRRPDFEFVGSGVRLRPQGTSSMQYPIKNFRFYLKDGQTYNNKGELIKTTKIKENSIPVDTFCMKADYAESSGAHNTGVARLWNDFYYNVQLNGQYVCRTNALKSALAAGYNYDVRTAIDGYPIVILYRDNLDSPFIFLGHYNFNNDKSTENVFGFKDIPGFNNKNMACWEHLNNTHPIGLFTDESNFDTDWDKAFEARYPEDFEFHHLNSLKEFAVWVNATKTDQTKFNAECALHLDMEKMAAYYIYLMRFGGVDLVVKNAMLTTEDGVHFYYIHYDNDTTLGLRNDGLMVFPPDINRQSIDPTSSVGEYCYAGHDSVLWNNLEANTQFMILVKQMDNALYQAGMRYEPVLSMFDDLQAGRWSSRIYNEDLIVKYIQPFQDQGINNLYMAQGSRTQHRRWWLSNRFSLYDALYVSGEYKSSVIDIKAGGTPSGAKFEITSGKRTMYGYGINNDVIESGVELDLNDTYDFTTPRPLAIGDPLRIYSAHTIKGLNLKTMSNYLTTFNLNSANHPVMGTTLEKIDIKSDRGNSALSEISGLKALTKLNYLDVSGQTGLTTLDVSDNNELRDLIATNTNIRSVSIAKGCPLRLFNAGALTSLHLYDLKLLSLQNLILSSYTKLQDITINNCDLIDTKLFIFNRWINVVEPSDYINVTLKGIKWLATIEELERLVAKCAKLDLAGTIEVPSITDEQFQWIIDTFGNEALNPLSKLYFILPTTFESRIFGVELVRQNSTAKYMAYIAANTRPIQYEILGATPQLALMDIDTGILRTFTYEQDINARVKAYPKDIPELAIFKEVLLKAYTYPTSGQIQGDDALLQTSKPYTLVEDQEFDGGVSYEWVISQGTDLAQIESGADLKTCNVKALDIFDSERLIKLKCIVKSESGRELFFVERTLVCPYTKTCVLTVSNPPSSYNGLGDVDMRSYNDSNVFNIVKNGNSFTVTHNAGNDFKVLLYGEYIAEIDLNIFTIPKATTTKDIECRYYSCFELLVIDTATDYPINSSLVIYEDLNDPTGEVKRLDTNQGYAVLASKNNNAAFKYSVVKNGYNTYSSTKQVSGYVITPEVVVVDLVEKKEPTVFTTKSTTVGLRFTSIGGGFSINWGDGTTLTVANVGATWNDHTYTDGVLEHTVTVSGNHTIYHYQSSGFSADYLAFKNIYKLIQIAGNNIVSYNSSLYNSGLTEVDERAFQYSNIQELNGLFANCSNLISIPELLLSKFTSAMDFSYCFRNCSSLTSIPQGLFDNNVNVTNFSYCFDNCRSLTSIPTGLFDNNVNVTNFSSCFSNCSSLTSIPQGLFDKNVNVTNFSYCFYNCSSLTSIPQGLFDNNVNVTSFSDCFYNCSSLTSIPTGLFDNNVNVTSFRNCFYNCSSLTSIPQGLFDKNVNVTNFSYCFYNCTSLTTIPTGLFDKNVNVTNFSYCFYNCSSLTTIPQGLFDNNVNVTNFSYCFSSCRSLTTIHPGLFDNNVKVINFNGCFSQCSSLNHSYNLTSPGKKKLWERNGDGDGVIVTSYNSFASTTSNIFKSNIPTTWSGDAVKLTLTVMNPDNSAWVGGTATANSYTNYGGYSGITDSVGRVDLYLRKLSNHTISFSDSSGKLYTDYDISIASADTTASTKLVERALLTIYTTKSTTTGIRFTSVTAGANIDWGDGTKTTSISTGSTWNDHTYTDGLTEHTVTIDGNYVIYYSPNYTTSSYQAFKNIYKLIQLTGSNTIYNSSLTESGLVEIDPLALKYSNITSAYGLFYSCRSLTTIPSVLFDNNVKVTDFSYCFSKCSSLTSIPQGLFDKNVNVTDFSSCFSYCSSLTTIPSVLFDKNVNVTSFGYCFYQCSSLITIPQGLFDNNVNVISFSSCFNGCPSLTTIHQGLFDKNVNVTDFSYCFYGCSKLTHSYNLTSPGKKKLWERNGDDDGVIVTSYSSFASNSSSIFRSGIPTTWGGTMTLNVEVQAVTDNMQPQLLILVLKSDVELVHPIYLDLVDGKGSVDLEYGFEYDIYDGSYNVGSIDVLVGNLIDLRESVTIAKQDYILILKRLEELESKIK